MHALYCSTSDLQSAAGSAAFEKSMHSSRFAFSSLHTQHGYTDNQPQSFVTPTSSLRRITRGQTHLGLRSRLRWRFYSSSSLAKLSARDQKGARDDLRGIAGFMPTALGVDCEEPIVELENAAGCLTEERLISKFGRAQHPMSISTFPIDKQKSRSVAVGFLSSRTSALRSFTRLGRWKNPCIPAWEFIHQR